MSSATYSSTPRAPTTLSRIVARRPASSVVYRAFIIVSLCLALGALAGLGAGAITLGLLVAAIGFIVVIERPLIGAIVLVSIVPTLASLDRGIPVPGLRLSEACIIGVFAATLIACPPQPWRKFDWVALAYVLCTLTFGLVDISGRNAALSAESLGKLIGPLEFLLLYRVILTNARSARNRRAIVKWMLLASIPVALLAIMQAADIAGTRALASAYAGNTEGLETYHVYRATALFTQGHLLGGYLMVIILIGAAYLFDSQATPLARRTIVGILVLDGLGLAAGATATPILGLLACLFMLAYWYGRLSKAILVTVVASLAIMLIFSSTISTRYNEEFNGNGATTAGITASGGAPHSLAFRWDLWTQQYLPTIDQHLLTGYGPELPPSAIWQYTESLYISLLLRGGFPLLFIFGCLMWIAARQALRVTDDRRPLARAMFTIIIALIVMHTQANYFLDAGLPQLWWALAGLLFAIPVTEQSGAPRAIRPHKMDALRAQNSVRRVTASR